jgi:hypothetical protein
VNGAFQALRELPDEGFCDEEMSAINLINVEAVRNIIGPSSIRITIAVLPVLI